MYSLDRNDALKRSSKEGAVMIKITDLSKVYKTKNEDIKVFEKVNLEIDDSGLVFILGPSGSGKSTLLNIVAGRDKDYLGKVKTSGNIVYLSQGFELFESMSLIDNLLIISKNRSLIESLIDRLRLTEVKNKKVAKLSNGQRKRLEFIKGLLLDPDIFLLDEVSSALDHEMTLEIMKILRSLSPYMTIIIVTHDEDLANDWADRMIKIEDYVIKYDIRVNKVIRTAKAESSSVKTMGEHLSFVFKYLRSRTIYILILALAISIATVSIFGAIDLNMTIRAASSYDNSFKYGRNIIETNGVTTPLSTYISECYYQGEIKSQECLEITLFDVYTLSDVETFVNEHPEIISIAPAWSQNKDHGIDFLDAHQELIGAFANYYFLANDEHETVPTYDLNKDGSIAVQAEVYNLVPNSVFFIDPSPETNFEYAITDQGHPSLVLIDEKLRPIIPQYSINLNYLVNDHTLPLAYGRETRDDDEIIIDKNTADLLIEKKGYSSYEDILDSSIDIKVMLANQSSKEMLSDDMIYKNGLCEQFDLDINAFLMPSFDYRIVGITSLDTNDLRNIYTNARLGADKIARGLTRQLKSTSYLAFHDTPGYNSYHSVNEYTGSFLTSSYQNVDNEYHCLDENGFGKIYFDELTFTIDPNSDPELFIQAVKDHFGIQYDDVATFSDLIADDSQLLYKNIDNIFPYIILLSLLSLCLPFLIILFEHKRVKKERELTKLYGYRSFIIDISQDLLIFVLTSIISIIAIAILGDLLGAYLSIDKSSFVTIFSISISIILVMNIFKRVAD